MRDYVEWHRAYDDPDSGLSWRLQTVQRHLRDELDTRHGPLRIVSICAGDGRDVIGVLRGRPDLDRIRAVLLELHPALAAQARDAAADLPGIEVRATDAGTTAAYVEAVPADVLLLVGVLGNISDADIEHTVRAVPMLCAAGALILWSRGVTDGDGIDRNEAIRQWFLDAGCQELAYDTVSAPDGDRTALGAMRFTGVPVPLPTHQHLFTFLR